MVSPGKDAHEFGWTRELVIYQGGLAHGFTVKSQTLIEQLNWSNRFPLYIKSSTVTRMFSWLVSSFQHCQIVPVAHSLWCSIRHVTDLLRPLQDPLGWNKSWTVLLTLHDLAAFLLSHLSHSPLCPLCVHMCLLFLIEYNCLQCYVSLPQWGRISFYVHGTEVLTEAFGTCWFSLFWNVPRGDGSVWTTKQHCTLSSHTFSWQRDALRTFCWTMMSHPLWNNSTSRPNVKKFTAT